jgi:hypothetical protein
MSESDTPRETCETCYGLGRVDAVYAPCPDCELTAARAELSEKEDCIDNWMKEAMKFKEQRDRLAEALKNLVKANETWNQGMMDVIGRPPNWNDSYLNEAKQALQSLTTNDCSTFIL